EYQDTNRTQYVLAKLLAAEHHNLCVVGDDAQSIYAFRGADIQNILSFQKDYPDAKTVRLEQNYRSTQRIVRLADAVIKGNSKQLDKELWTDNVEGDPVVLMESLSERDEAQKVERTIRDLRSRSGIGWRDVAVLYRTNAQSRSIEEALRRGGIPYRMVGGTSFYQRKEIKDALAYLRLAVNPSDDASILRVINAPTRGIGGKTVQQLRDYATEHRTTLWQAVQDPQGAGLSARAGKAVEGFGFLISRFASKATTAPADELARELIQETGLLKFFRDQNTPEALARLENIHELLNAVAEFAGGSPDGEPRTMSEFLQEVSLVADVDRLGDDENRVTLMTLHASKGLEFKVVFVTGLEEGLFPLAKAAQDPTELEEERRLLYVGVTRAEEALFLTYARSRYRYGDQQSSVRSRFLDELDGDDLLRTESGGRFESRAGRFQQSEGGTGRYGAMDPNYWKTSLRPDSGPKKKRTKSLPRERQVVYDEGEGGQIVPGVRVHHQTFGNGKVIAIEGAGDRAAATVFFNSVGQKKLKLAYARLQVVG
ncbi:ATP-dependent helicase, partial [Rubrivirga sp.]|uniref:ATP-dependent helicase n=1 Tax=Rubrivirga sp. TaxID=1885344 RepID=UPI003C78D522